MQETEKEKKVTRHPLALPRGSVRALLALSIFGTTMALLAMERAMDQGLWLVNYVMLGYYFASRQSGGSAATATSTEAPPLRLPRGTVRWLLILGFVATAAYLTWQGLSAKKNLWEHAFFFPMLSLGMFFLGRVVRALLLWITKGDGGGGGVHLFNDGKALLALLSAASILLVVLFNLEFPGAPQLKQFSMNFAIFYFGSR